jgi:hypothetical protein
MTNPEARALTAKLIAAFQGNVQIDPLTAEAYREALETFPSYQQALEVVTDLIRTEVYRPPVAVLVDTYNRYDERRREQILQLDEVPPTPEERAANLKMAREWQYEGKLDALVESMEMP